MTNLSSYYRVALDAKYKGDAKNTLDKGYVEQQLHEIEKRKPTVLERAPARGAPASTAPDRPRVDVLDLKKIAIPALPKARREILVQPPTRSATTSSTEIARATPRPTPPPVRPEPGTSLQGTKTSRVQIVAAYNLPRINGKVTFTPDLLAGILLGDIRAWNDPAVRILNPGIELPAIPIVVVPPSNDPQLSAALDDYLARSPIWKKRSEAPGETQMEARAGRVERGTRNEWVSPSNGSLFIVSLEQTATNKSLQFTVLR